MIDIIFEGAQIVDGTGAPAFTTDLAVVGSEIALLGDLTARESHVRVPCNGMVLAPGFFDANASATVDWLANPDLRGLLGQGITTAIVGGCGVAGPAPGDLQKANLRLHALPLATGRNVAAVREAVAGGAIGLALDLRHGYLDPGLLEAAREGGATRLHVHLRDEGDELLAAVDEAIGLARSGEFSVHIAHLKTQWKRNFGRVHQVLERIDAARRSSIDVTVDVYPYVAVWMRLTDLLPATLPKRNALALQLSQPQRRAALAIQLDVARRFAWRDLILAHVDDEFHAELLGLGFDEIARRRRLPPARAAVELLAELGDQLGVFAFALDEDDIATILTADFACIGTSAAPLPLENTGNIPNLVHPRAFGTTARIFGRFVRQRGTLTLEEAVRRMTLLPAHIFGQKKRGRIAVGQIADVVVFDPETFVDTATYAIPRNRPTGLRDLFVSGSGRIRNGEFV